ncbi:hypothetical protein AMATHDRAFT_141157 [Amanita thiersii Skay4041]|uniref:BZIP domain-containing protein n=1 Tax=Amanita thiersii Skay4041 TaxID=703135 RepID=A0A2A9NW53_9AGAR|nr:hypothetical protein AMATHDRAFT_141157 [Amanita thiersii Skay4041]
MTRGRKKDLTIPPSRALLQQRDYRARRAHYITSLEERCRRMEEENAQLRRELAAAKLGQDTSAVHKSSQAVEASTQLLQHLSLVSASLARFQQVVFPEIPTAETLPTSSPYPFSASPVSKSASPLHSPTVSLDGPLVTEQPAGVETNTPEFRTPDPVSDLPISTQELNKYVTSPDCCGGFLDCRDMVDEEHEIFSAKISGLRSTSSND